MAFIRSKRVPGREGTVHTYNQVVKNYREDGRHRQRVLAHLGHHDTVEEALEAARKDLAELEESKLRREVAEARWEVEAWERNIQRDYGDRLEHYHGGEIPTLEEVKRRTGEDKTAPVVGEYEETAPWGTVYKRPLYGEVAIPPEVDEYCRAFGGEPVPLGELRFERSPNRYGHTVFYRGLGLYKRWLEILEDWRERAEKKGTEYNRKHQRLLERIDKLGELAGVVTKKARRRRSPTVS